MRDKVVLITGAARRIGAAIATHLHAAGAHVIIHYHRSGDAALELVGQLAAQRAGSADVRQADLRDVAALTPLVESVTRQFGRLDGLVNNASSFYATPIDQFGPEEWDDLVGTNLRAPLFLAQAAAPALRQGRGSIVNLVDIHAWRPLPGHALYCTAKAGLDMLTRALARELGPEIRVNGVAPGPILWPERDCDEQTRQKIISSTALQRSGDPLDVASTVLFLMRDANYITGQVIAVDGGRSI